MRRHESLRVPLVAGRNSPEGIGNEIRSYLRNGGSTEHATGVQRFFNEEIKSHGWCTEDLRKSARLLRGQILALHDFGFLLKLADNIFSGAVLEEKVYAIFLLENLTEKTGDEEFRLLETWLPRISNWADHDALVHCLIAPMIVARPVRVSSVFKWARFPNRWHRRAACVALIRGTREKLFFSEIVRLSNFLLNDQDDLVQKGLGWLLRETAKADAKRCVPYLRSIARRAPRIVLRTACETLPAATRKSILAL